MICTQCEAVMNAGERFCGKCGASLDVPMMTDEPDECSESQLRLPVAKAAPGLGPRNRQLAAYPSRRPLILIVCRL
jgi:hypothetical protein